MARRIVESLVLIVFLTATGSMTGWGWGTMKLWEVPEYWAGEFISEDNVPRVGLTLLGGGLGLLAGSTLAVARSAAVRGARNFDLILDPAEPGQISSSQVVAILLGLDSRSAEKLIASGSPLLRNVPLARVGYFCERFDDFHVKTLIRRSRMSS